MSNIDELANEAESVYFPIDLDVRNKCFYFQHISINALTNSTFLDNRFTTTDSAMQTVTFNSVKHLAVTQSKHIGYLFHTSFCCSTLLARLLDFPKKSIALKEPLILRRLSDAALDGMPNHELTDASVKLLFRNIDGLSAVLVKPTHVALNIAQTLLSCNPSAKALLITSTLEDFMISNIKKTLETQRKVPELVERFMTATDLPSRLPPEAFEPPSFLAGVSLQWHAQQQLIYDLLNSPVGSAVCVIQDTELLQSPAVTLRAALDWLEWDIQAYDIDEQIKRVMNQHAKSNGRNYNLQEKTHETNLLRQKYSDQLSQALQWSALYLSPYLKH